MDVASEGELAHALAAGAPGERSSSTATTSRTPMSGPPSPPGRGSWSSTIWPELDQVERIAAEPAASSRSCFA